MTSSKQRLHILCVGGAGYIGSHTVISIAEKHEWDVTVLDNLSNSSREVIKRLNGLSKNPIPFLHIDLMDSKALEQAFHDHHFDAVIHYAGLKSVDESVSNPLKYYTTNIIGTLNLLNTMEKFNCRTLVFSSSATVYRASERPLKETDPLEPSNPYGHTKLHIETILRDLYASNPCWKISILRYFNPIGAHPSGCIGESPKNPLNLLPYIQQVAVGRRENLFVFGQDWNTPDGTGVRDYIHVMDLANGHIAALHSLLSTPKGQCAVFNLGTGIGTSVLQMVKCFEKSCGKKIPVQYCSRRKGDLSSVVADPTLATIHLNWTPLNTIQDACDSAWKWQSSNPNGYQTVD